MNDGKVEINLDQRQQTVNFRNDQYGGSRLCEYLTGMRPEDSNIIGRLREDQGIVRRKYGLPVNRNYRIADPSEYIRVLKVIAKENGVSIRNKHEYGDFFEKYTRAGAVYRPENNSMGVDVDESTLKSIAVGGQDIEHELIHALQKKKCPSMPVEIREYEAYLAAWNIDYLEKNQECLGDIFHYYIYGSVLIHYDIENKKFGLDKKPEWDNVEWFLKNVDKVID